LILRGVFIALTSVYLDDKLSLSLLVKTLKSKMKICPEITLRDWAMKINMLPLFRVLQ